MPSNQSIQTALSLIEQNPPQILNLTVGPHQEVKPGQYIPRAEAQSAPQISFPVASSSATYMVVALDIDAPFPSFNVLGPILHWIQPGLKARDGRLEITEPSVVNYIGPAPPPGSSPHRYLFFLYEQPSNFEGKAHAPPDGQNLRIWSRVRYSLDDWGKTAGLGPVLAVNYFCSN
ncbi:phosphatidylethanolamine-binding protein [Aspergillus avenaceus]|uniref:Phosphatidylethanolamine-binding protein n=1 Tax=Aspergillus avenaceus TaxID=36643 RepID=A0A5N6U500_ASPAV|nr:phosphatidylethanolamine-binding protein [Aspergillus avenaceus]